MDQIGNECRCNCHVTFCGKPPELSCYCNCGTGNGNGQKSYARMNANEKLHVNYNKMLNFIKKHCKIPDHHTWENEISGWHREIIINGIELLKEIENQNE